MDTELLKVILHAANTFIASVAWPLTTIAALLLVRGRLIELLGVLRKIRIKDVEAEFDVQRVSEQADEAELPDINEARWLQGNEPVIQRLYRLADYSPGAAVFEAWREVELAASEAVTSSESLGSSAGEDMISPNAIRTILKQDFGLSHQTIHLVNEMRQLRNQVVHAKEHAISTIAAREYAETATRLAAEIRSRVREQGS